MEGKYHEEMECGDDCGRVNDRVNNLCREAHRFIQGSSEILGPVYLACYASHGEGSHFRAKGRTIVGQSVII